MSTVIGPFLAFACSMEVFSAAMSRMSVLMNRGGAWPSFASRETSAVLAASSMSMNAILDFYPAKASTMAAPIPEPPPVMNTLRPSRLG
jgi:hypothetical protein